MKGSITISAKGNTVTVKTKLGRKPAEVSSRTFTSEAEAQQAMRAVVGIATKE